MLARLVEDLLDACRLECAVQPSPTVLADAHRIEQTVKNLVSNALKFTPAKGHVTVGLSAVGGFARLVVSDTGEGIPADFIPHVFEAFSQVSSQPGQPGLALGLAIVKHLVEAHHGRIRVKSPGRGRGATFVVDLPLEEVICQP